MAAERDIGALFTEHGPELQAYLTKKLRCPHMAADFTQELFLRLAELPAIEAIGNVRSYLYQAARNLVIDHFRKEDRQQTYSSAPEELGEIPADVTLVDDALSARQELLRLQKAMQALPQRTQLVFFSNKVEGLTYAQVAHRLNISESSVQKHLAKALLHVMKCLET